MKLVLSLIFVTLATTATAFAEFELIDLDPYRGDHRERNEREGRNECRGYADREFSDRLDSRLAKLKRAVQCGDLEQALKIARAVEGLIERELGRGGTEYGECYLDRDCTERASQSTPTKDMCEASEGKSWKRTNPSEGSCERVN